MKVVITGASGFLGHELIKDFIEQGNVEIVAFTSNVEKLKEEFPYAGLAVFARNDMHNGCLQDADVLINCAFPRNSDGLQMALGLKYIQDILEAAVNAGVKNIINISSQSVYSQAREAAAVENSPLVLETQYAVGKYASELLTNSICKNVNHTNLRIASLIGPKFEQRLVNKMLKLAIANGKLSVLKDQQCFGFMDIRDVSKAILTIANTSKNGVTWKEVYNIGIDGGYSLVDIAEAVKEFMAEHYQQEIIIAVNASDKVLCSKLDSSSFKNDFGWSAVHSLKDTIASIDEAITRA